MIARRYPQGVPCWVDTEQNDVDGALEFYGGLFGWTFEDVMPPEATGRYVIARLDGQDVGAIAGPQDGSPVWSTYFSVDDADAAVQRMAAAGASVRSAPANALEAGRGSVLADEQGVEFRIWQAGDRLGAQVVNQPGAWNFSDLHTSDPNSAIGFYQKAFGWEFDDVGFATMIRQPGYGDHLEAAIDPDIRARQAGVAPPGFEDAIAWLAPPTNGARSHWHVTFTVSERDRSVAAAERLGAQVIQQDDSDWTRSALIRDPQGAEFTVSQFAPVTG